MRNWINDRWRGLADSIWLFPVGVVVLLGLAAVLLVQIDRGFATSETDALFGGDASAARSVLTTIAGSLITVAGLTFSVTVVVLQLASSQFSPRVLRTFLDDRITQLTAGAYVGLFIYCLLVLRTVRGGEDDVEFVPALAITTSIVLAVAALGLLLVFIGHVVSLVQVANIAARVHATLVASLEKDDEGDDPEGATDVFPRDEERAPVYPGRPGYVQRFTPEQTARELEGEWRIEVCVLPGEFVATGQPLAFVHGRAELDDAEEGAVAHAFHITNERNVKQDAPFALRQLSDIALRAISPSVNDPTTARTCVGYLRSSLVLIARRRPSAGFVRVGDGRVLFALPPNGLAKIADPLLEIGRHAESVPEVGEEVVAALASVAEEAQATRPREAAELADASRVIADYLVEHATPPGARERLRAAAAAIPGS